MLEGSAPNLAHQVGKPFLEESLSLGRESHKRQSVIISLEVQVRRHCGQSLEDCEGGVARLRIRPAVNICPVRRQVRVGHHLKALYESIITFAESERRAQVGLK